MADGVQVEPDVLDNLARGRRDNMQWPKNYVQVVAPDGLPLAGEAAANLNENAQLLEKYVQWAQAENNRISDMLETAAKAYRQVDDTYGRKMDNPERQSAIDNIAIPVPSNPMPALPGPPSIPKSL